MKQIIITSRTGKISQYFLNGWMLSGIFAALILISACAFYAGQQFSNQMPEPDMMLVEMQKELAGYQRELEFVSAGVDENLNALAQRLALSKAHIIRLNALGERVIEKAKLNKGEFDFDSEPSLGGPESANAQSVVVNDFSKAIVVLEEKLEKSEFQLNILESMLLNRDLQDEVYPSGRPIKRGWISSYFGFRTDPFSGRRAHHDGIDLAGKEGTEIVAVAAGVVTWAGKRSGYGLLVEINHGNGYVTRYGHNKSIDVEGGDTVTKGQTISRMGSTGRSTGPHVHFEVHRNGRVVDPMKYVKK